MLILLIYGKTKWYDNNKILQLLQIIARKYINLYLASAGFIIINNGFVVGNCYLQKNKLYL